jgi:FixJ family two-component response regulator
MDYSDPTLYVIDDLSAGTAATELASALNIPSRLVDSAEAFLECYRQEMAGCILAGLRVKQMGGVDLLKTLT